MMNIAAALILSATTMTGVSAQIESTAPYTIDTPSRTFRDKFGRARIFHGTNVVVKLPPYLPTEDGFNYRTSMTDEDM